MNCFVCNQENNWHMMPKEFMGWPDREMGVCKTCGNMAYHVDPQEEQKVKEYYKNNYRGNIGPSNLITTSRKLNYVKNFIQDWLTEKEKDNKQLIIGDVGCATGYIVDWFRRRGHKATGSEWTPTMRRFAEHFYGFPATEELTAKHKYDLITMYHTFEHMIEPDKKLQRYVDMLADGGHMLVSTPEWMAVLEEAGTGKIHGFKELFHKDHINVFTQNTLKKLFNKAGLFIEKENHIVYGQTYLLRKRKEGEALIAVEDEPWEKVVQNLEKQKKAIELYMEALKGNKDNLFREALNIWPKFPDCYYDWILNSSQKKDRGRCAELIQEAIDLMPYQIKVRIIRCYFLYQNQEYVPALEDFDYIAKNKINEDILMYRGYCLYHLGRIHEAMASFNEAALLNPQKWMEAMTWMCKCASEAKAWDEVAADKLKQQLFDQAQVQMVPKDPLFENEVATNGVDAPISNGNGQGIVSNEKIKEVIAK